MQIESLIQDANGLVKENDQSAKELGSLASSSAIRLTDRLHRREDLTKLIGEENALLMETNHVNHFKYIASLASVFDPRSFVEVIIWVLRTYQGKGFSLKYWEVMLPEAKATLQSTLSPTAYETFAPVYDWIHSNLNLLGNIAQQEHSFFERLSPLFGTEHKCTE